MLYVTYQMERSRDARRAKLARVKKDDFVSCPQSPQKEWLHVFSQHRQSQELDIEVASMIEMAETASATSGKQVVSIRL